MLLLISTVNSGKTARRALDCIQYYGGKTQGIAAVFSAIPDLDGIPVLSLFTPADIPGYETYPTGECRMCKAGQRIDALANSYGLSTFRCSFIQAAHPAFASGCAVCMIRKYLLRNR